MRILIHSFLFSILPSLIFWELSCLAAKKINIACLVVHLVKVTAIPTRGNESTLRSGPEEFIYDYERESLNSVSTNQEMMKSLGVNYNIYLRHSSLQCLFLCVYVNYESNFSLYLVGPETKCYLCQLILISLARPLPSKLRTGRERIWTNSMVDLVCVCANAWSMLFYI